MNKRQLRQEAKILAEKFIRWDFSRTGSDIALAFLPTGANYLDWQIMFNEEYMKLREPVL